MFNVKYRGVELSNTDHSIKKLIMRITDPHNFFGIFWKKAV